MPNKHFCIPSCFEDECPTLEEAYNDCRAEMIREGLPPGLVAFKSLETSIILLTNINAQRYLRMREMHVLGDG